MEKRILITGAGGLIGSEFYKFVKSISGYKAVGIDNFSRFPKNKNTDVIDCDLRSWVEGNENTFDYIYHFAAINGTSNFYDRPLEVIENNTTTDLAIFNFAKKNHNCKLIYASSSEVIAGSDAYPSREETSIRIEDIHNPRWSYRLPKILAENYLMNSNINFAIIRFFNIYSELSGSGHFLHDIVEKIKTGNFDIIGPQETRSFCYIKDVLESIMIVGENTTREIVNIGSDEEIKIIDAANIIATYLGVYPTWKFLDPRVGSVARRLPDLSKIRTLNPKYSPRSLDTVISEIGECL